MILNPFPKRYKVTELSTSFFPLMFLMTMLRDEILKGVSLSSGIVL
ncbi:hypothetical protein LEP1GSC005_0229 [Leptospira santarosai str. ST188]|nr:hypothetical protein LEP1GSC005_0229 [Leptospira santarosai str. ST188]